MEEHFDPLRENVEAPEFETKPRRPLKVGLSNIIRRTFGLMFGWNRGKMRRIGADDNGAIIISPTYLTSVGMPIKADVAGRVMLDPDHGVWAFGEHFIGTIAAPGAGAPHALAGAYKRIVFHGEGVWAGRFNFDGPDGLQIMYGGQWSGQQEVFGRMDTVTVVVVAGAVNYCLTTYMQPT